MILPPLHDPPTSLYCSVCQKYFCEADGGFPPVRLMWFVGGDVVATTFIVVILDFEMAEKNEWFKL